MEMTVPDERVTNLIEYINLNNPTHYDYPVGDITVVPVTTGNAAYIKWAKESKKIEIEREKAEHEP